jgi:hypothetical protein
MKVMLRERRLLLNVTAAVLVLVLSPFAASAVWAQTRHARERLIDSEAVRRLSTTERAQTSRRESDSVLNGALIGAGAAVATGLLICTRTEPWENCRDDVGPMLRIGAIGAGIGIAIDALIRRKVPSDTTDAARVHATPIVARETRGVRVSSRF